MTEEDIAREAIGTLEAIMTEAEEAGMDVELSRRSLGIARNFLGMGRYEKAMAYCRMAENDIR